MFDIDLNESKEKILKKAIVEHQQALSFCQQQVLDDKALDEQEKAGRINSLNSVSNAVLALNVTIKLMEENNKVIWNKLVELGLVESSDN